MRINKFIASCGISSRRKAEELILSGKVKVNDKVVKDLATDIKDTDSVMVNNKLITLQNNYEYYMLNKPKGYVCSASDDRDRKIVLDLINTNARIFPVGRLDKDSSGLILLTNNGDLVNECLRVENGHEKEYIVEVDKKITTEKGRTKKIETPKKLGARNNALILFLFVFYS